MSDTDPQVPHLEKFARMTLAQEARKHYGLDKHPHAHAILQAILRAIDNSTSFCPGCKARDTRIKHLTDERDEALGTIKPDM